MTESIIVAILTFILGFSVANIRRLQIVSKAIDMESKLIDELISMNPKTEAEYQEFQLKNAEVNGMFKIARFVNKLF
jgi:hypothetical protein